MLTFSKSTTAIIEYNLSDFSNSAINLYDVTDFSNVKLVSGATISGGQLKFQASETEDNVSKYIAGTSGQLKSPINPVKIDNSNLRGDHILPILLLFQINYLKASLKDYEIIVLQHHQIKSLQK